MGNSEWVKLERVAPDWDGTRDSENEEKEPPSLEAK